jgi:hypothetical protein
MCDTCRMIHFSFTLFTFLVFISTFISILGQLLRSNTVNRLHYPSDSDVRQDVDITPPLCHTYLRISDLTIRVLLAIKQVFPNCFPHLLLQNLLILFC